MAGSIRKRGKRWEASHEVPVAAGVPRRREYKTFARRSEAEHWLRKRLTAISDGTFVTANRITVAQALDEWLRHGDWKPETHRSRASFAARVREDLGSLALQQVTPPLLRDFISTVRRSPRRDHREGPLMGHTVNHVIRVVKAVFKYAVEVGYLSADPSKSLPTRAHPEQRPMTILTKSELGDLLTAARGTAIEPGIWIAGFTGMRRGEVLGLRWRDVDLEQGEVRISSTITAGPGGKSYGPPKTPGSRRKVGLPDQALEWLRAYRRRQTAELGREAEFVCTSSRGEPWNPAAFSTQFRSLLRRSGLRAMRFHDLRHTHVAHLIADGLHIKTIADRLGHSSTKTTSDTYSHILPGVGDKELRTFHVPTGAVRVSHGAAVR